MRFVTRKVDAKDPFVLETIRGMITESFEPGAYDLKYLPKRASGIWWITTADGEPAAFAHLKPSVQWQDVGYMSVAGVLPAFRGHGLQRRLIRARVDEAVRLGWHTLVTEVIDENVYSIRNLLKEGFLPYAPKKPWGNKEAVYLRRQGL